MPIDKKKYPPNWEENARACKEAAGWKCTKCGREHRSDGTMGSVLTVHHPDRDTENPDARLVALCARCHLQAEVADRIAEKMKDLLEAGQLELFDLMGPKGGIN